MKKFPLHKALAFLSFIALFNGSLILTGCSATDEAAFLANAPAVINGTLATATDLYAAYAAANQQLNGQSLNVGTGIEAANAAAANLGSSNIGNAVTSVFTGLNSLAASIKAANPSATTAQITQAQSSQIVAAQNAVAAATPAGTSATTMLQIHYNRLTHQFVVSKLKRDVPFTVIAAHSEMLAQAR